MTAERIYWDSNVFLDFLKAEPNRIEKCEETIRKVKRKEAVLFTSTLTIAEVLWLKGKPKVSREDSEKIQRFFHREDVRLVELSRSIAFFAQELVWQHTIKPKDAVHVATALRRLPAILETFDRAMIKLSGTLGDPPLVIREPPPPKQPGLKL